MIIKKRRSTVGCRNLEKARKQSQFVPFANVNDYIRKYTHEKLVKSMLNQQSAGSAFSYDASDHAGNPYKSSSKTGISILGIYKTDETR
nr:expressed protein [Hymenolepis microstoma]